MTLIVFDLITNQSRKEKKKLKLIKKNLVEAVKNASTTPGELIIFADITHRVEIDWLVPPVNLKYQQFNVILNPRALDKRLSPKMKGSRERKPVNWPGLLVPIRRYAQMAGEKGQREGQS